MENVQNVGAAQQVFSPFAVDKTGKVANPKVDLNDPVDSVEFSKTNNAGAKKPASLGKKIGVAVASTLIPGVGQFINKDVSKGFGYMGANVLVNVVGFQLLGPLALIPSLGISIAAAVDAVKNA